MVAETRSDGMTKYLISFNDGAIAFPGEDLPAMADAVRV